MTISMNINEPVWVKITDKGREILTEHWKHVLGDRFDATNYDRLSSTGWVKFQLWDLMNLFGKHVYMGNNPPFELTIMLTEPK